METYSMDKFNDLFKAILKLKNIKDCQRFFEDICSIKELEAIAQRLEVAKLLSKGHNYLDVSKETGASSATISRVNKSLNYGTGGIALVINKKGK